MATNNKELVKYDEMFAAAAKSGAKTVAGIGGQRSFSIKSGKLTLGDTHFAGDRVGVVVLAHAVENVLYKGDYDPANPTSPSCYAFGVEGEEMRPHPDVVHPVSETCKLCPNNQYGSAERGKGKACRNRARLTCLVAGTFDSKGRFDPHEDLDELTLDKAATFSIPPTSLRSWASYVNGLSEIVKRPTYGIYTQLQVAADPDVQVRVSATNLGKIENTKIIPTLIDLAKAAEASIKTPYPVASDKPAKTNKKRRV